MGALGGEDQQKHAALAESGRNEASQGMGHLSSRSGSTAMGTGPGLGAGTTSEFGTGPVGSQPSGDMYRQNDANAYPGGQTGGSIATGGMNDSTYGSGVDTAYGSQVRPGQEQQFGTSVRATEPQGYSGGNAGYGMAGQDSSIPGQRQDTY